MYHVSPAGEVGECRARIQCPFGSFETHHYATEEDARSAFEAGMAGLTLPDAMREQSKAEQKRAKREARDRQAREEWFQRKREKVAETNDIELPPVLDGHYVSEETFEKWKTMPRHPGYGRYGPYTVSKKSDDEGEYVEFSGVDWDRPRVYTTGPRAPMKDEHGVWVDVPDPEAIQVREALEAEATAEAALVGYLSDAKRLYPLRLSFPARVYEDDDDRYGWTLDWDPKTVFGSAIRIYKASVEDAKRGNIALPHAAARESMKRQFGMNKEARSMYFTDYNAGLDLAGGLLTAVLDQDDEFRPTAAQRMMLDSMFPRGERPFIDYKFSDGKLRAPSWRDERRREDRLEEEAGLRTQEA